MSSQVSSGVIPLPRLPAKNAPVVSCFGRRYRVRRPSLARAVWWFRHYFSL